MCAQHTLKEAIEQQLEKAAKLPPAKTYQQTAESPDGEPKVRFEILMTKSEKAAVLERSNLERCSKRRWIIDAIRAGLTREPQFGMKEIDALGESNYQLLAIGRNLNQVAKAMNEGKRCHSCQSGKVEHRMSKTVIDGIIKDWGERLSYSPVKGSKGRNIRSGSSTKAAKPSPPSGPATKEKVARTAKKTAEVMVKISGGGKNMKHIKAHMDYISRNGDVEIEDGFVAQI